MDVDRDDTSESPRPSASSVFWSRLAENVARRRFWFLAPILLVTAIGVLQVRRTNPVYESTAVLDTTGNPLLSSPDIAVESVASLDLDADAINRLIEDQLATDTFVADIAVRAGLRDSATSGPPSVRTVRRALTTSTTGTDLLRFSARWPDAQVSQRLAAATIEASQEFLTDTVVEESSQLEAEQQARLDVTRERLDEAATDYDSYVATLPNGAIDDLTVAQRLRVDRLAGRLQAAERAESETQSFIDVVSNVGRQASSGSWNLVEVVDEPRVPVSPTNNLPPPVLSVVGFAALGILIAIGAALTTTALDHSISTPSQLASLPGVPMVLTTESVRRRDWGPADPIDNRPGALATDPDEAPIRRDEVHA